MVKQSQINGLLSPLLQYIRIKKILPFIKGNRILDIGSSNGELLKYLPRDIDYIGIEGNAKYCKTAQLFNPNYKFINLYIDGENFINLNIPKRDTIVMLAILEHLNKPVETLKNLKKFISKNGNIIITTPNKYSEKILKIGSNLKIFMSEMNEHKNHFSKKDLFDICRMAGTKVIHYSKFEFGFNHLIVLKNYKINTQ